jgi:lipoate---protein ligase
MLLNAIAGKEKTQGEYRLTPQDIKRVHRLMHERYLHRGWNFGSYSTFDTRKIHRFPAGSVEFRLRSANGRIQGCKFYGDFFGHGDPADLEQLLIGHRRDDNEIRDLFETMDTTHYFHGISKEGLLDLIV